MSIEQASAFAVIGGMMALFVWGRLRYDLVAVLSLMAAYLIGIVPAEEMFTGFSEDIIFIIASALIVSAAVSRSGIVEILLRKAGPYLTSTQAILVVLVGTVTILSAFVKNIGALAMLMPVAFQLARRNNISVSYLLMPMAFGSLLGGTMTLIGTSPNIIVSGLRKDLLGEPFRMFDFMPVGAGISILGVIFLAFGYRLLPAARKGTASADAAFNLKGYTTEAHVPADSPFVGKTVADLVALAEGEVEVSTIIRERFRRYTPSAKWTLYADDVLLLEGEPSALEQVVGEAKLKLVGAEEEPDEAAGKDADAQADEAVDARDVADMAAAASATSVASPAVAAEDQPVAEIPEEPGPEEPKKETLAEANADDIGVMEAVVQGGSPLIGRTSAEMRLSERYQLRLLAVSRSGERLSHRLRSIRFQAGDVLVLQGHLDHMSEALGELECLPLAQRDMRLGRGRRGYIPVAVLAVTMLLLAFQIVPVAVAFFGAAIAMILFGTLTLRESYDAIDWPLLVLIGALIPVSQAMQTTGATDIISDWLSYASTGMPGYGALALIVVAAMAVTPFLNNAATVLVMAPIAAGLSSRLGFNPDPFLIAVALGAASDFLTPIGHQSNTLVMGPGGYRFGDYWRLGLPLSVLVVVVGVPLIMLVFPLVPG